MTQEQQQLSRSVIQDGCSIPRPALNNLPFEAAMIHLRNGQKIRRAIWKGYWFLANDVHCQCPSPLGLGSDGYLRGFGFKELIVAVLADGGGCAPAQPYQADLLATDWEVVDFQLSKR